MAVTSLVIVSPAQIYDAATGYRASTSIKTQIDNAMAFSASGSQVA
jgi:hypothetical protein